MLYLNDNNLTEISLDGAPNLQQLTLADNYLTSLNVDNLSRLVALSIDHNYFRFSTLPPVKPSYMLYQYHSQYPVDVVPDGMVVDLSSEAVINGVGTDYTWYLDMPYVNENGELEGENLYEGTEYTIENGVTTFLTTFDDVVCVMLNSEFPELILTTDLMNISDSGVEGIGANGDTRVAVEGNSIIVTAEAGAKVALVGSNGTVLRTARGSATMSGVAPGVYVVVVGNKAYKIAVR